MFLSKISLFYMATCNYISLLFNIGSDQIKEILIVLPNPDDPYVGGIQRHSALYSVFFRNALKFLIFHYCS